MDRESLIEFLGERSYGKGWKNPMKAGYLHKRWRVELYADLALEYIELHEPARDLTQAYE